MPKKLVIFDMDGVLFDSIEFGKSNFLKLHPGITEEIYKEILSGNYHEEAQKYSHLRIKQTEEEKKEHQAAYAAGKSKMPLFAGIKDLLKDLHNSGCIIAINTNAWARNCLPLLEQSGIKQLFDFVATADLSKNKTEKFKLIEDKYSFAKENVLFVTDSLGDLREAEAADIPTVAVTWGVHDESYFNREAHPYLVGIAGSIEELKSFI